MSKSRQLTVMALLVAIGTLGAQFIWFPAGIAKAYPVQHAINVLAAIMLGPGPAVAIAFMISLLRNMLGLGSLLAFPGSMIGAFLAAILYRRYRYTYVAAIGEVIGTGVIGALFAVPFAKVLMGTSFGALFFIPPFIVSSVTGGLIAIFIAERIKASNPLIVQQD
ncbi:MAG TPA: energy coupling factor transporter S component ThiW [Pseudogracilibacillus sp.]|nr:energy coupling factor transporter S component ThiW [Pseudogracilibacillus sp.]